MVQLLNLKISNLYSYGPALADSEPINFSNVNSIVGPNNSGKSNIFRSLKLIIDMLKSRSSLDFDKEFFSIHSDARLDAEFLLSDKEAQVFLDFLSIYKSPITPRDSQRTFVYQYKNREAILNRIKRIKTTFELKQGNHNYSYTNTTFYFPDLKITIFSNGTSQAYVTNEIPFKNQGRINENFPKFLDQLNSTDITEQQSAIAVRDSKDEAFCIDGISLSDSITLAADKLVIQGLLKFVGMPMDSGYSLYFSYLLGAILGHAFLFSSGGSIFYRKNGLIEKIDDQRKTLSMEMRESLRRADPLEPDGWNLAEFLFNLKNSEDPGNRLRFNTIQKGFTQLFPDFSFDVIYKTIRLYRNSDDIEDSFHYPTVVLFDGRTLKQYELDKVGAGISESLFLLTAFFGASNSVILLDEPAVNLHPAQMKALFHLLGESSNQFLIITHSPPLLQNLLFDREASVVYVRRPESESLVKTFNPKSIWGDLELYKLSYLIDPRVFFARHVLLTEGETDRCFLEAFADIIDLKVDTFEDIIIKAEGTGKISRYKTVLQILKVPYVVVADSDGDNEETLQKRAIQYGSSTEYIIIKPEKVMSSLTGRVFFFEGDVERFILSLDAELYTKVEKLLSENELSACKPALMHEYIEQLMEKDPKALDLTIKPLLQYAFSVDNRAFRNRSF